MSASSSAKRDSDDEGDSPLKDVELFSGVSVSLSSTVGTTTPAVRKAAGSITSAGLTITNDESPKAPRPRKRKSAVATSAPEESLLRRALRLKNVIVANITRKKLPFLGRAMDGFQQAPHHVRALVFVAFVAWKFIMTFIVLPLLFKFVFSKGYGLLRPKFTDVGDAASSVAALVRVLYIVGAPYRFQEVKEDEETTQRDRLSDLLVPILQDGVESMVAPPYNFQVDVYLLTGYKLESEARDMLMTHLPDGVGLQVWDDALPLDYPGGGANDILEIAEKPPVLLRHQRLIIRDKINDYDFFIVFEDGIRVTGAHAAHFLQMSRELNTLQTDLKVDASPNEDAKEQVGMFVPGFVEVEVLSDGEEERMAKDGTATTPFVNRRIDPEVCCSVPDADDAIIPSAVTSGSLVLWEPVNSSAVRKLSSDSIFLDRVFIQPGSFPSTNALIADVSDSDAAKSWGWMATREQLIVLHKKQCDIFPRYYATEEGKGGQQTGCSLERVISLHPDHISKHLVYHAANNKHKDPLVVPKLAKADNFYGQLISFVERDSREILAEQR